MSTLTEIEREAAKLPPREQAALIRFLNAKLASTGDAKQVDEAALAGFFGAWKTAGDPLKIQRDLREDWS